MRPADCLAGISLEGGWTVTEQITKPPHATGGHFSVGYLVQHESGRIAYLKALDFSGAFQTSDPARELQAMTAAYNFERDLLAKCRDRKLQRIVTPLADGNVDAPGAFGPLGNVCYLIFEYATGDIRDQIQAFPEFDLAWCLRSLHHTAVGLKQLHSLGVAHQDLKPSNVLVFHDSSSKIADLGRASDSSLQSPCDNLHMPGDVGYAPPEQFYAAGANWSFADRCLADLYLLGSLFFFYFAGCSATQAIQAKLHAITGINLTNTDFASDLPYIRQAFDEAVIVLEGDVGPIAGTITPQILSMASELCEPDPSRRGDPKMISSITPQYSLERYVSRLNLLASKAEFNLI